MKESWEKWRSASEEDFRYGKGTATVRLARGNVIRQLSLQTASPYGWHLSRVMLCRPLTNWAHAFRVASLWTKGKRRFVKKSYWAIKRWKETRVPFEDLVGSLCCAQQFLFWWRTSGKQRRRFDDAVVFRTCRKPVYGFHCARIFITRIPFLRVTNYYSVVKLRCARQ